MSTTSQKYKRLKRFEVHDVLPHIGKRMWRVRGLKERVMVRMGDQRMLLIGRTQVCACCGAKGAYFWLEHSGCRPPHFNLYAINEFRQPVMLTMDHIIPKSKGGTTTQENLQLLCTDCNALKAHHPLTLDELKQCRVKQHMSCFIGRKYRHLFVRHKIPHGYRPALVMALELGNAVPEAEGNRLKQIEQFMEDARQLQAKIRQEVSEVKGEPVKLVFQCGEDSATISKDGKPLVTIQRDDDSATAAIKTLKALAPLIPDVELDLGGFDN